MCLIQWKKGLFLSVNAAQLKLVLQQPHLCSQVHRRSYPQKQILMNTLDENLNSDEYLNFDVHLN